MGMLLCGTEVGASPTAWEVLSFGAGLVLGVASKDTAGTQFCCYFIVIIFLQSHSGCM